MYIRYLVPMPKELSYDIYLCQQQTIMYICIRCNNTTRLFVVGHKHSIRNLSIPFTQLSVGTESNNGHIIKKMYR